jgi:GNAT superfamily N-acetyltransferase
MTEPGPEIIVRPLTAELWPAVDELFDDSPVCRRCRCMYPRIGNAYRRRDPEHNRADFRQEVEQGPPPGLLGFAGELPVGWCRVTPRSAVPALDRLWRLKRVDALPVWSLSCLYVRKGHRGRGLTRLLISAALDAAGQGGAPALEAYPLDRSISPSATSTGVLSTFLALGFREVARRAPERPVVRRAL